MREFQADFSTGDVDHTSFATRPDAVARAGIAFSFGPTERGDTSEGLLARAWYARVDSAAQTVYIARAKEDTRLGWEPEEEWFTYTGADFDEFDLTFDQNGNAMAVVERSGNVWIYYFKPIAGTRVFEDFGAGRNPRCILDEPGHPSVSDVLVFYIASGTVRYREQSTLYTAETDSGVPMSSDQYLEGLIRDTSHRVHLVYSTRDEPTGTYSIDRLSSLLYPLIAETEGVSPVHVSLAGTLELLVVAKQAAVELVAVGHETVTAELLNALHTEGVVETMNIAASVDGITMVSLIVDESAVTEAFSVAHGSVSGTLDLIVIERTATTEEASVSHSSVSGLLQGSLPVSSGLVLHHDAQAITGLNDGDTVDTWADESGNGHTAAKYAGTSPMYRDGTTVEGINGHPAVRLGSSAFFWYELDYLLASATEGEVFAVLQCDAESGVYGLWHWSASNASTHHPYGTTIYEAFGTATRKTCGAPGSILSLPHYYNVISADGEYTVNINGSQLYTTATNTVSFLTSGGTGGFLGKSRDAYYFFGLIGELLIYDRQLSTAERAAVLSYLTGRWS